jgi:hypothetical protein
MNAMLKLVAASALALLVLSSALRGVDAQITLNQSICTSTRGQECSFCATFAPCTNSVDPRCITTDALDCLECVDYSGCAPCAPGWDKGCMAQANFEYDDGSGGITVSDVERCALNTTRTIAPLGKNIPEEVVYMPLKYQAFSGDSKCQKANTLGWSHTDNEYNSTHGVLMFDCNNKTACENLICEDGWYYPRDPDSCGMVEKEDVTCDFDPVKNVSVKQYGDLCGAPSCNTSLPCGEKCTPGVDDYCVVIGVWRNESSCDFTVPQTSTWATNGDWSSAAFETSAIFDGKCHRDGSGRDSWYRGGCFEGSSPRGRGVLGCSDDKCTKDCLVVEAEPNTCFKESWTGGLYLALLGNEGDGCQEGEWETFFEGSGGNDDKNKTSNNGTYEYALEFEMTSRCDSDLFTGSENNEAWSEAFSMALFGDTKYSDYVDVKVDTNNNDTTLTVEANTNFAENEDAAVLIGVAASDAYEEYDEFADAVFKAADENVVGDLAGNCNVNRLSFGELEVSGERSAVASVYPTVLVAIALLLAVLF